MLRCWYETKSVALCYMAGIDYRHWCHTNLYRSSIMKSFQEQLWPVIQERHRSDDEASQKRHLKEASTPAAETLMTYIRQWNSGSYNIALGRLLECDRWQKDGTLALECDHKGKPYPVKLPLSFAYERYMYGDQQKQYYPNSLAYHIKDIPANITPDWAEHVQSLFYDIQKVPLREFKLIALGKWVKCYGASNPHSIAGWDRDISEWKDTQAQIDAFVRGKGKGWEHLTTEHLQRPSAKVEMSKVLCDILANADAIVEPAFKALKEQARRDRIRQEATYARNNVKELKGFFQKYGLGVSAFNALTDLGKVINDTESQTLSAAK